jgi:hypothetical protein
MLLQEADQAGHLVTRLHQCVVVIYEGTRSLIFFSHFLRRECSIIKQQFKHL